MMRFGRIGRAVAVALIATACAAAVAVPANASTDTIGVGIRLVNPATARLNVTLTQGTTTQFQLSVSNPGTVTSYVTLFSSGAGGVYSPSQPGGDYLAVQPVDPFNSWNSFSPATFTLAPGASQLVTDTITVPIDAPLGLQPGAVGVTPSLDFNVAWAFASSGAQPAGQVTNLVAAGVREYVTVASP